MWTGLNDERGGPTLVRPTPMRPTGVLTLSAEMLRMNPQVSTGNVDDSHDRPTERVLLVKTPVATTCGTDDGHCRQRRPLG